MNLGINLFQDIEGAYSNRQEPERLRSLAQFFWRTLLLLSAVLTIVSVAYGALTLSSLLTNHEENAVAPKTKDTVVDRAALDAILSAYKARDMRYQEISNESSSIPDPFIKR